MKSVTKKIIVSITAVILVFSIVAVLVLHNGVKTEAAAADDNGETPIKMADKTPILDNIMEAGGKLVILEIVPYEKASVFNMLIGTEKVTDRLEDRKKQLYEAYSYDVVSTVGTVTTVKVSGNAFYDHPFTISYNQLNKDYTVNYPNFFLEEFLDGYHNPQALSYFMKNTEVRTVTAGNITKEDLEGVSFIYISSMVETEQIISFNAYINGEIDEEATKQANPDGVHTQLFDENGNEYNVSSAKDKWYNAYIKNADGDLIPNDMPWKMVTRLVKYVYGGNEFTEGNPVPCLINYGNPASKSANMYKLTNLLLKTSNEEGSVYTNYGKTISTYYLDVLDNIATYKGELDEPVEEPVEEPVTEKHETVIYMHSQLEWDSPEICIVDAEGNDISSEAMAEDENNLGWYKYVTEYSQDFNILFKNGEVKTSDIMTVGEGSFWFEVAETEESESEEEESEEESEEEESESEEEESEEEESESEEEESEPENVIIVCTMLSEAPEGFIIDTEAPEEPVEVEKEYFYNDYGIKTGAYVDNGNEYVNWGDGNVLFFDIQCTKSSEYAFNFIYKTMNNYRDSVFTIGMQNVAAMQDDGSASLRDIGSDGKYYVTDVLKYLLGVESNGGDVIRVLEIQPCQDYNFTYFTYDTAAKKQEVVNNIINLAKALRIRDYTRIDGSVSSYEALDKKIVFTSMTVKQFCGINEELMSAYDIIYVGDNNDMMNYVICEYYDEKGQKQNDTFYAVDGVTKLSTMYQDTTIKLNPQIPIYNDRTLDGYVYTAFGDLIKCERLFLGYLPSDYVDVTDKNYNGWSLYSDPHTEGIGEGSKWLFAIDSTNPLNETLWTPLVYNALKVDNTVKYYVAGTVDRNNPTNYASIYGNMRFTANDFTKRKMEELKEFIDYGNPVILSDNVFNCTNPNIYTKPGGVVYPTSQVYQFVSDYTTKDGALLSAKKIAQNGIVSESNMYSDLMGAINEYKLNINDVKCEYLKGAVWYECPEVKYETNSNKTNNLIKDSSIVEKPEKLRYTVTFSALKGKQYMVSLINDKNKDGLYKEESTTDDTNELMYRSKIKATSNEMTTSFEVVIPNNYNGMYSWRVQIVQINNNKEVDKDVYDGYVVIKGDKKIVRVLQILPVSGLTLNLKTNTDYNTYLNNAAARINYEIIVDTIVAGDFEAMFHGEWKYTAGEDYNSEKNFLKYGRNGYDGNYSMVVIGFADCYGKDDISDDNGALSNILDFVAAGGSILFTHDTISFTNNVNYRYYLNGSKVTMGSNNKYDGDKMNVDLIRKMRDLVGMDRYHVTTINDLSNEELERAGVPKKVDGTYITEIQGYTDFWLLFRSISSNSHDSESMPGYGTAYHRLGDTNNELYTCITYPKSYKTVKRDKVTYGPTRNLFYYPVYNFPITTTKADEINKGQVTAYPYNATDSDNQLKVSTTHAQYNQLNMEDPEIVVWYTLSGGDKSYYGDNKGDVFNNYYIYSKDNITYSGAGHSNIGSADELKLFVNTIIKAADAGNNVPEVKILNGSKMKDSNAYIIYTNNALDSSVKVEFMATDEDLATREMLSNLYDNEADIYAHIGRFDSGRVIWIDAMGNEHVLITYSSSTSNMLLNGERYSFYICDPYTNDMNTGLVYDSKDVMKACFLEYAQSGTVKLRFEATDTKGETGMSTATIVSHDLFDLD